MLRIEIPTGGALKLDLRKFEELDIPVPANGIDSEENGNIVLLFEDEQEAVDYTLELDRYAEAIDDHHSPRYKAANEVIKAIGEDGFVKTYIQD